MKLLARGFAAVLIAAAAFAAAPASAASRTTTTHVTRHVTTHTHTGVRHATQRPSHTRVVRTHIHRHRPVCRTDITRVMRHGHMIVRKVSVCR
jgi:archaellin